MKTALKTILLSGIVAGILDCLAAVVFLGKMNFAGVWKYVASGFFGGQALVGGNEMVIYGLVFHFSLALFWATVYYYLFTKIKFFINNSILGGLLYGIIVWLIMNFVILPLTHIPKGTFTVIGAIKNVVIIMLCIGLPISLITNRSKKL